MTLIYTSHLCIRERALSSELGSSRSDTVEGSSCKKQAGGLDIGGTREGGGVNK